jgi:hypothetical protein
MAAAEVSQPNVDLDAMAALSIQEEEWSVPKEVRFTCNNEQIIQKVGANEQTEFRVYAASQAGDLKAVTEMFEKNDSNKLLPQMAIMGATAGIEALLPQIQALTEAKVGAKDPKLVAKHDLLARIKQIGTHALSKGGSMFWQFRHEKASFSAPIPVTRKSKGAAKAAAAPAPAPGPVPGSAPAKDSE